MRWTEKKPYTHTNNSIQTWFAVIPYTINGETRWLEYITVEFTTVIIDQKITYKPMRFV
jgi:hypothetical protein